MSILNHPIFKRYNRFEKLPLIKGGTTHQVIYPLHTNKRPEIYTTPIIEYNNILDVIKHNHLDNIDNLENFYLFYHSLMSNNYFSNEDIEIIQNNFKKVMIGWKKSRSLFYCWSKRYIIEKKIYVK